MKDLALRALDAVARRGVTYADVRAIEIREREISTKNGKVGARLQLRIAGLGIRVLADGCWGFAATDDLTPRRRRSRRRAGRSKSRAPAPPPRSTMSCWRPKRSTKPPGSRPCRIDPFSIPVDQNLALLLAVDAELRRNPGVTLAEASMHFDRRRQVFASTLGSLIDQTRYLSRRGIRRPQLSRTAKSRSDPIPNSFGGQHQLKGYELIDELRLLENAPRIAEEAVALHSADQCPEGEFDLILDSSQLGLQIHESIGHPIELDRVLGSEANYAGMSFLTLDKLATCATDRISSTWCAMRAWSTVPGLGTFAFDDEGVPAQCTDIIRDGQFVGYMTSRETAAAVGRDALERQHARRRLGAAAAHPHDQREPAARRAIARRSLRRRITPSTWRPTRAGRSTTSATTSSSAARSAGRSATASACAC